LPPLGFGRRMPGARLPIVVEDFAEHPTRGAPHVVIVEAVTARASISSIRSHRRARLGNAKNLSLAGARGRATQIAAADEFVSGLLPVVLAIRQTGANTLEAMSCALNQRGIRTARGGQWRASSVANLFCRARRTTALLETLLLAGFMASDVVSDSLDFLLAA
jgi:hypothetical protein